MKAKKLQKKTANKRERIPPLSNIFIQITIAAVMLSVGMSFFFSNYLPEKVASHWDVNGAVNGYMPKEVLLAFFPILTIILTAFLYFLPKFDPMQENIQTFRREYNVFIAVFANFMVYIFGIIIALNIGFERNILQLLNPGMGLLLFAIGYILPKTKINYFVGIRTPWTWESEKVWEKTHKLGGKLFNLFGALFLIGMVLPTYFTILLFIPFIIGLLGLCLFSYIEFKKELRPRKSI